MYIYICRAYVLIDQYMYIYIHKQYPLRPPGFENDSIYTYIFTYIYTYT